MQERNILVVDDDIDLRDLVKQYLSRSQFVVRTAGNAEEMHRELALGQSVDLLVLDVMLPGRDGVDICRELRSMERHRQLPIVMLTARNELLDRVVGLEVGADDYVAKPFEPRELLARINAVLRRAPLRRSKLLATADVPSAVSEPVQDLAFDGWVLDIGARHLVSPQKDIVTLANSDYRILHCLLQSPGRPVSRDRLATEAFGRDRAPTDRAVDVCISRLRAHLERDSRHPALIRTVRHEGYMYCPTRSDLPSGSA